MGQAASELLARTLAESGAGPAPPWFEWISRDLGRARVDLEDKEALQALLEKPS